MERLEIHQPRRGEAHTYDVVKAQELSQDWVKRVYAAVPSLDGVLVEEDNITLGENSIEHKLGRTPVGVMLVKDEARPVFVDATHTRVGGTQLLTSGAAQIIQIDATHADWGGDFDTSTYLFTAPHTGIYSVETAITATTVASGRAIVANVTGSSLGPRWFSSIPSSFSTNVLGGTQLLLGLTEGETLGMYAYSTTSSEVVASGSDETRLVINSDETWSMDTHDDTHLSIWSKRDRSMSFWVY